MRKIKFFRTREPAILIFAFATLLGCGRKDSAPTSQGNENSPASPAVTPQEASLDVQTEQKLDPLTSQDVELYLKVMRAAADRVKAQLPGDQATLESAKKILIRGASGRVPTPDEVKTLEKATLVALSMDQIVAGEMKIDSRNYRGIAEAIESVLGPVVIPKVSGDVAKPLPQTSPTPLEQRLSSVNDANKKILAPYHDEIQKLIIVVRNSANLPK
jgi:hypothetical protein